jgi:hypothetical protein
MDNMFPKNLLGRSQIVQTGQEACHRLPSRSSIQQSLVWCIRQQELWKRINPHGIRQRSGARGVPGKTHDLLRLVDDAIDGA